ALLSMEGSLRNPNWFRRKLKGFKGKELLNAEAVTDASGMAQFRELKLSTYGNTRSLDLDGSWALPSWHYSIDFNCDGKMQESHAWSVNSGGYITEVVTTVAQIRIQRFIRKDAELGRYGVEPAANGTDTFLAVVRVLDANGNGVAGKSLNVQNDAGDAVVELAPDALEMTNEEGFAVVAFQAVWAAPAFQTSGQVTFKVRFSCDGARRPALAVESPHSQDLLARLSMLSTHLHGKLTADARVRPPVPGQIFRALLVRWPSYTLLGLVMWQEALNLNMIKEAKRRTQAARKGRASTHSDLKVNFPGISAPNTSSCFDISGVGDERRLGAEANEVKELHAEVARRLRKFAGAVESSEAKSRKLSSGADGAINMLVEDAYSNDGDRFGFVQVRHDPWMHWNPLEVPRALCLEELEEPRPMIKVSSLDHLGTAILPKPVPQTLRQYNDDPNYITFASQFEAGSGDHFLRMVVQLDDYQGHKQECYSSPVPLRIQNVIGDIVLEGDAGPGAYYEHVIQSGSYVDIDLSFILDASVGDASDLSRIPNCIFLSADRWDLCAMSFVLVEAPYNFHRPLGMTDNIPEAHPLSTEYYTISAVQRTGATNAQGYDATTGKLHLRMQMNQKGIYGNFGIQFRGFGVNSRVFTWRVLPPPGLRLEMVQDPAFVLVPPWTGNLMDQIPIVRVLSDEGPVNGLILSYDLVPVDGGEFTKLTVMPMYSTFPFLYSGSSGSEITDAFGQVRPAQDGVAYFPIIGIVDGMRFIAEGVSTEPLPSQPICLSTPYSFQIVAQPPSTWPLNIGIDEFGGSITVEVRPNFGGLSMFTQFLGGLLVRLLVSSEGGRGVNDAGAAQDLSQRMLGDHVCVFVQWREPLGRCTDLVIIQTTPFLVMRFSFLKVRWLRRISQPARISLKVSDLSGSDFRYSVSKPPGFENMSDVQKFHSCSSAVQETLTDTQSSTTIEIAAETTASQFFLALVPPEIAIVGNVFLVRLRVTTASGAPVRDVRVRAGIQKLAATSPGSTSPGLLQSLVQSGRRLEVLTDSNVELDPTTTVRVSKPNGIISFPLTITRAMSGTYKLLFQPDGPNAQVVLETKPFKVENPIYRITSAEGPWGQVEIPDFGMFTPLPRTPRFCVETATNESLAELQATGVRTRIQLILRGAPSQQESAAMRAALQAKEAAKAALQASANNMAANLSQESTGFMKTVVDRFIADSASQAKGSFAGLTADFARACLETPLRQMQVGDPFTELGFGNATSDAAAAGLSVLQSPSLSEALGMDPSALEPSQILDQFQQVLMSAGGSVASPSSKQAAAAWEFSLDDLHLQAPCEYVFNQPPLFAFAEDVEYEFTVSVNGVESSEGFAFKVVRTPPDPVDVAFNWFCSGVAAIVGVIILITNVTHHRWLWFIFALLCTVGLLVAAPFLSVHRDALYGVWIYVAVIDLVLILATLVWGMTTEVSSQARTFDTQRSEIFEAYTRRRLGQALGFKDVPSGDTVKQSLLSSVRRTFLKPFNAEDAFFFPSALLVANLLSLLSFTYIFAQSIQVLRNLEALLNMALNTALDKAIALIASINLAYFQLSNADLPDSATDFMYVQIGLMRSWFQQLIDAIIVGFTA
ncbi:unnamed protein product, partial [Symbiodinium microadriaticum]